MINSDPAGLSCGGSIPPPNAKVNKMKVFDAITEVRRKIGIIFPNNKEDIEWMCKKIVVDNKEVFDKLR